MYLVHGELNVSGTHGVKCTWQTVRTEVDVFAQSLTTTTAVLVSCVCVCGVCVCVVCVWCVCVCVCGVCACVCGWVGTMHMMAILAGYRKALIDTAGHFSPFSHKQAKKTLLAPHQACRQFSVRISDPFSETTLN